LFAREGKVSLARSELGQAEQFDPGLTHENARSVAELKAELGQGTRPAAGAHVGGAPAASHFPWTMLIVLVLAIGLLWMLFRRRSTYPQYPAGGAPVMGGGPGTYGPTGYGGGVPMSGGGIGSGIAGGLASGLAVGAGVVAGEEVARHFLDGGSREGTVNPPANNDWEQPSNGDMGGSDFGVNDSGSWDDSGGGGGDGGGDWS
jgi:hypothetical protein